MESFSQRNGMTNIKNSIQIESIDDDLKKSLWNGLTMYYWNRLIKIDWIEQNNDDVVKFLKRIWMYYFKNNLDEMPQVFGDFKRLIKKYFFSAQWFQIYDFIEFIPNNYSSNSSDQTNEYYIKYCNECFNDELSAYRFVKNKIIQISSKEEIESIEEALKISDIFKPVEIHLMRALELYADRKTPDYRNSIKESISAVESYCSILTKSPNATLGQALKQIEIKHKIHPALKKSFSNLYGYTSDEGGIRHALMDENILYQEDAKFMLVACSAFINYLKQKEAKIIL
jgi:hypothetical protein